MRNALKDKATVFDLWFLVEQAESSTLSCSQGRNSSQMDEKRVSSPYLVAAEKKSDALYSMCFGVSCAFFALRVLSRPEKEDLRWLDLCNKMLQGSSHLLGLLVWRVQIEGSNSRHIELLHKLETAHKEVDRLKQIRHEDAKANEKVVSIFATQEQCWLIERKKLQQHITALMNIVSALEKNKNEVVSEMSEKLREMEVQMQFKDKVSEEEEQNKRKELEVKLTEAENTANELRESAKHEAQQHAADLLKQKTAFIELVSNQRHIEAELGRALKQLDAKRRELNSVFEQKEESLMLVQKLSMEVVKMRKDVEQKEKIMSAMLQKSKLDTAEKQMLMKEVKLSKSKRKQAELETERWRAVSERRHERHPLRNMFSHQSNAKRADPFGTRGAPQIGEKRNQNTDYALDYDSSDYLEDPEGFLLPNGSSPEQNDEIAMTANVKQLEGWVHLEAEKYGTVIEDRHQLEVDAFAEQMRIKDERLEACRWQLLRMEVESKRLESHVERLNQDMSELRHDNMKLETLLLAREEELKATKEKLTVKTKHDIIQNGNLNPSLREPELALDVDWSKVLIVKRNTIDSVQGKRTNPTDTLEKKDDQKEEDASSCYLSENIGLIVQNPEKELGKEKVSNLDPLQGESKSLSLSQPMIKKTRSEWKKDLHALGVSYKIKRLKQQVLMLERLAGKQESGEDVQSNNNSQHGINNVLLLISLLNKQVGRYQSLHDRTDELCKRMHDHNLETGPGFRDMTPRPKRETKALEHFLEETFQLQRYMVATGQRLGEVQSKIASGFIEVSEEVLNFDMKRFADNIRTLYQEVQRGLEVRIARIIGDLEGTLACDGMIRMRR
ncbi:hypothetical protein K2173_000655 [Erythroxylum novogranatense]|uniref:Uncharacterized protein n=1 Tax=Erythroxylum novogranatense TaxID=1862640 RepID=A0AAV8SIV2_9ROSI|nr:hypothetical protein K2173_000655 [Erythroxylum novogranatense]